MITNNGNVIKVWIVKISSYDTDFIDAVFSTEEKAKQYKKTRNFKNSGYNKSDHVIEEFSIKK